MTLHESPTIRRHALLALALCASMAACSRAPRVARPERRPPPPLSADAYAHYLRGRLAMLEGNHALAVRQFRAAGAAAPGEAAMVVALVEALLRSGHRQQALLDIEAAQKRWPDDAEVWLTSGHIYRTRGDNRRAIGAFERAISAAPGDERGYLGLGAAHLALGEPERAEKTYRQLVEAAPESLEGNLRLGLRLLSRGQYPTAEQYLGKVLELDPDHVEARVELARTQRAQGRRASSIATLRNAFDRSGGDPRVGQQLFLQLLELGERAEALALLAYLDGETLDADARVSLGYLYLQVGERRPAEALARAVLARHPVSADARLLLAQALRAGGRSEEALEALADVAPERPGYPSCRAFSAEILADTGRTDAALQAVEEALSHRPRSATLIAAQARVLELTGKPETARRVLRAALAARPRDVELLYASAAFEDRMGNAQRAVEDMERVLAIDPDNADAMNFIGYSLADRNVELARAERLLLRALDLSPGNGLILDSYGWLLFRQKRLPEAAEVLGRALRLAPEEPEILWHLGEVQLAREDRAGALKLFEQARSSAPRGLVRERIEKRIQALRSDR